MKILGKLRAATTGELAVGTGAVAIVLLLLQSLLQVNSGYGVEDFLGWTSADTVRAMVELWRGAGLPFAPWAYLGIDTFLFVPLYALLLLRLGLLAEPPRKWSWVTWVYFAAVAALVVLDVIENLGGFLRLLPDPPILLLWSWPHAGKRALMAAALGLLALGALLWFAGAGLSAEDKPQRARFRGAVGDMLVRSRYVLLALALLGGLLLVLDQSRDIVYAMAAFPFRGPQQHDWTLWGGTVAALTLSALAVWLLMFSCWFWTRSVCQIQSPAAPPPAAGARRDHEERFAELWARLLGAVPILMLVSLLGLVIQDCATAAGIAKPLVKGPVHVLLAFGVLVIGAGIAFLAGRASAAVPPRPPATLEYYNALSLQGWCRVTGILPGANADSGRYWLFGAINQFWIPILALLVLAMCRLCDAWPRADYFPSMAFPVMLLSVTFWLCLLGWVSLLEVRKAVPWVLFTVLVIAVLCSRADGFENQLVWGAVAPAAPPGHALIRLWWWTAGMLAAAGLAYALAVQLVRLHYRKDAPLQRMRWWGWAGGAAAAVVATLAYLVLADQHASERATSYAPTREAPARPRLDAALASWLTALCDPAADGQSCRRNVGGDGLEVFFVSTEGGGIRAAAWTALALNALMPKEPVSAPGAAPDFAQRTFSISGVSGGSVGAAAFRACMQQGAASRQDCLQQWAGADALSPMLGAWMFEDLLARVLPTSALCTNPGCGFLSRAAWFEQTLESSLPQMRQGLVAPATGTEGERLPYLFLNSTWVETGERAIASDVQILPQHFGGAGDQLKIARANLSLSTASHNSARFPYINAIGALRGRADDCPATAGTHPGDDIVCGHLADGGYFDNSGAQTTLDILAAFGRCIADEDGGPDYAACRQQLSPERRKWLRQHLVPRVLMIRSGVALSREAIAHAERGAQPVSCPAEHVAQPVRTQVDGAGPTQCTAAAWKGRYDEARPVCRQSFDWLVQLTGPPVTLLNVSGLHGNRHLAESRQATAVASLRAGMDSAKQHATPPVTTIDLVANGVRYPLGWHLSGAALGGMLEQVQTCTLAAPMSP